MSALSSMVQKVQVLQFIVHILEMEHLHILMIVLLYFPIVLQCSTKKVGALDANTDREALLNFKSMVSDPLKALSGWNSNSSHCTWFGVSCTKGDNRVSSLSLAELELSGATIPPQLSNLSSLEVLNLFNNSFYGQIPKEFSQLTLLQHIILATNKISGTIPVGLSQCYGLKVIRLEHNQLTGHLPPELGNLSRLEFLDVSLNNLTSIIPPTFGNLTSLTYLALARNQLIGNIPNELGFLRNLHDLQLSENQFTGKIPNSISNMSSLVFLSLTNNDLSGELPTDMWTSLQKIFLANNRLEGLIPGSLSNASQIQELDLSSNNFKGTLPLLGKMKNLVKLHLGINNLSSTTELNLQVMNSLSNCTQLEYLMLNSNRLIGELPSSVANLSTHLKEFCVDDNFLTGRFPQGFERFKNLTALAAHQNSFTGEIPSSIGKLQQLQVFMAQGNRFSGPVPEIFSNLTRLFFLTLGYNQFSGRIPVSIGKCQHLGTLRLPGNRLDGSIPKEIFGLPNLRNLYLAQNILSGSLPLEVGTLAQLEALDVSNNMLSGNIPTTIGSCLSLSDLSLARNKFVGPIPASMGKLVALNSLNLSSNTLSGPIPVSMGKLVALSSLDLSSNTLSGQISIELETLHSLKNLNLSFNDLEGHVPTEGVFVNFSWDSFQGNEKLCGSDQEVAGKLRISTCSAGKKSNNNFLLKILIPVAISIILVGAIFLFTWALICRKQRAKGGTFTAPPLKGSTQMISYSEIWHATNGFAAENLIGKGGFGSVYKGTFSSREDGGYTTLAIKVLDLQLSKACKSFNAECEALRNVRHRNLVKVFTSCSSIDHKGAEFKALIMEFMTYGNLHQWLYPEDIESGSTLSLTQRLSIAIDVASAMDYLHHDCDPPIVHCDLKPGNVLLDDDMGGHVGDFGLARFLSETPSQNQSSTIGLKGSIGYIAPEYGLGSNVSMKGDVYSFGVLLLEIFTGKKPTDEMFQEGLNLNKFASAVKEKHILEIIDPRLVNENGYSEKSPGNSSFSGTENISSTVSSNTIRNWDGRSEECLAAVIRVGLSCAAHLAKDRLTMRETLKKLQDIKASLLDY